jgi:hypothetical protein
MDYLLGKKDVCMHSIQTVGRCWKAILALLCPLSGYNSTLKAQECLNGVAWVVSIQGRALLKSVDEPQWRVVRQGERICPGDQLRVTANSRAGLVLHNDSLLRLAENSELLFSAPTAEGNIYLDLLKGISHILSRIRHSFQINTPYINAYVEGTEFTVASGPSGAQVTVLEGQVVARIHYEQTIEPTQVAGFNQYFDDKGGSEVEQFGLGMDTKFENGVSVGIEFVRRDLVIPIINADVSFESSDEKLTRSYLYWPVIDRLGI